ncbi:MAG TPA: lasso RiPP family leader peptide-containing protein [Terriglobales bacterium]|nr:lasso RiPP family leader peptide-containing protein [Terriglobales bacterium]
MDGHITQAQEGREKKPYSTPRLTPYGDLQKLTRGTGNNGFDGTTAQTKNP